LLVAALLVAAFFVADEVPEPAPVELAAEAVGETSAEDEDASLDVVAFAVGVAVQVGSAAGVADPLT
jgi:hypothetical protein